jgi:hypothetical protein
MAGVPYFSTDISDDILPGVSIITDVLSLHGCFQQRDIQ